MRNFFRVKDLVQNPELEVVSERHHHRRSMVSLRRGVFRMKLAGAAIPPPPWAAQELGGAPERSTLGNF
jgi:hypothetical protein